jgi:hypothetical protein
MMIDVGRIGIQGCRRTPLDTLETPVVVLGGSEDSSQGIPQEIKGNDVRVGDGWHGRSCEKEKRGNSYW